MKKNYNQVDVDNFLDLCKDFLKKAKEQEKDTSYVCEDDFSVLFRLFNTLGVWGWLNNTGSWRKM